MKEQYIHKQADLKKKEREQVRSEKQLISNLGQKKDKNEK
jgi:hypothetical protein